MGIFQNMRNGWQDIVDATKALPPAPQAEQKDYDYREHEPQNQPGCASLSIPGLGNINVSWTSNKRFADKANVLLRNSIAKACISKRAIAVSNIDLTVEASAKVKALLASPNYRDASLQNALRNWETLLSIAGDLYLFYDLRVPGRPQIHSFRPDLIKNDVPNRRYLYDPTGAFGKASNPDFIFEYDSTGRTTRAQERTGSSYRVIQGGLQHVSNYDPRTASEGAGAGDSALRSVDIMNAIDGMLHRKFAAGGNKAGWFQISGTPTDAELATMQAQLNNINPDGSVNILPPGIAFNAAQLTFREMDVLETRNQVAKDICTAFEVPAEMVNEAVSTFANARGKDKIFYRNFIGPEAHFLVGQLEAGIRLYVEPSASISVDETSVQHLEEDRIERAAKMAQMKSFTANEIRAVLGYEPLDESGEDIVGAQVNMGQPEEKPKGPVSFSADAGNRGDNNEQ